MKLKVCGLTEKGNVLQIIKEIQPGYLGFIFYNHSRRFVEDHLEPEFVRSLPAYIKKTGVFVNSSIEYMLDRSEKFGLDALQLHGSEKPELCRQLMGHGYEVIKVFSIKESFDISTMNAYTEFCDYFLFDTAGKHKGGNGVKFNWNILQQYPLEKSYFLSGGVAPEDGETICNIKDRRLYGTDINSRFETDKGIKNTEQIKQFYHTLKKCKA